MSNIMQEIKEAQQFIRDRYAEVPEIGVVLGSGLSNFRAEMEVDAEIEYAVIPHFPKATVEGHSGKLLIGKLRDKRVVAMSGRFHYYEGYTAAQVVFPIRVMKMLGIKNLLISNAAGGVNENFKVGDLMMIRDQISLSTINPLIGPNVDELGLRFPDMSEPYSKELMQKARRIANELTIDLKEGVYYGVTGPSFETRAEYKMIRTMGADAVGMSTVQEVIAAAQMGLPVFALSVITDIGIREEDNIISHEDVLNAAVAAEPKLSAIFAEMIAAI